MIRRHAPWLAVLGVVVTVALVPPLRDQARFQWVTLPRHFERVPRPGEDLARRDPIMDWAGSYRARCVQFVQGHLPSDPEMIMAAGILSPDRAAGLKLLERAAELKPNGVTLSAYLDGILEHGPYYETPATLGVDPRWARDMAGARRSIEKRHIPLSLSKEDAIPLLSALSRWRSADPRNALPVAVEAWCLYGLGHRDQAIARWQEAAQLSDVSAHVTERANAVRRLLVHMGLPVPEAVVAAEAIGTLPALSALSISARIAYHEGRRAQLAGRAADALRCWQTTVALGQRAQACAELVPEFQLGAELEQFGAAPAWRWLPDAATGARGGPGIMQGRFFFGPQHAFHLSQVGKEGDAELRDAVVATRTRTMMLERIASMAAGPGQYTEAGELLVFGQLLGAFVLVSATILGAATALRPSNGATGPWLRSPWHFVSSLPALFVLAVAAGITIAFARECAASPLRVARGQDILLGVGLAAITALAVPVLPALLARRRGVPVARGWLESLRAGLVSVVVVGALIYLGLGLGAMDLRARWLGQKLHPVSEMDRARAALGPRWDDPPVRPGSWIEDYPPLRQPQ